MPYTLTIFGDAAQALRWVGFAKVKAARHKQDLLAKARPYVELFDVDIVPNVPQVGQRRFRPEDGVTIDIFTVYDNQRIVIRAEGGGVLYMESGLLDALNIAYLAEQSYLAGILEYGDTLKSYQAGTPDALLGRAFLDREKGLRGESMPEGESNALNLPPELRVPQLTVQDLVGNSATFGDPDGPAIYLPPPIPYQQKRTQSRLKPSLWGGNLLAGHVQALYGSLRSDYNIEEIPASRWFFKITTVDPDVFLDYIANFTTWIYVDADGNYWLMRISFHNAFVRAMRAIGAGAALQRRLATDPPANSEELRRQRGYLLSTLQVDDEEFQINFLRGGTESPDDGLLDLGVPPGYGWKANFNGDTAYLTQLRESPEHNDIPGDDYAFESRMWKCTVIDSGSGVTNIQERFRLGIESAQDPMLFFPRVLGGDNIWAPSLEDEIMLLRGLNLDPNINQPYDNGLQPAILYNWWGFTSVGTQRLHTVSYAAERITVNGEDGDPFNAVHNASCLGDPGIDLQGFWVARRWFNAPTGHRRIIWTVKDDGGTQKDYSTEDRGSPGSTFVDYKFTEITRDSDGAPQGNFVDWSVDDTKTLCNQGRSSPTALAQELCVHPETGQLPEAWYARAKIGKAARQIHLIDVGTQNSQIALILPRDQNAGVYMAQKHIFSAVVTYSWAENDVQVLGYELMGAWDGSAANPGPLSLATKQDFLPSFVGFGTTKHIPIENLPAQPSANTGTNNFTVTIASVHVDYWGDGGWERDIFESYSETGFGTSGGSQEWPNIPDSGIGSSIPRRRTGVTNTDGDSWDADFLRVTAPVNPITSIPSALYARTSFGRWVKDIWRTPPTTGSAQKILEDSYTVDNDKIHRTWVGHE